MSMPAPLIPTAFAAERDRPYRLYPFRVLAFIAISVSFLGAVIFLVMKGIVPMSIVLWIVVAIVLVFALGLFFLLRALPFMDREDG